MNILRKIREVDKALNQGLISYQEAADAVAPFTDAEPVRHGRWEDCSNGWMCSVCNRDSSRDTDYCPHCGAKMDKE